MNHRTEKEKIKIKKLLQSAALVLLSSNALLTRSIQVNEAQYGAQHIF